MSSIDSSGVLRIGTATATALTVGRTGVNTTFTSGSTVTFTGVTVVGLASGGGTFTGTSTFDGPVVINNGYSLTLNGTTSIVMGSGTISTTGVISSGGLTSTGVVTIPAGSVGAPSLTFAGDTNTGIYQRSADVMALATGGLDRFIPYITKAGLTNNTSNSLLRIGGMTSARSAGLIVNWTIEAVDATNMQTASGQTIFAVQETAGALTASVQSTLTSAVNTGTFSCTWGSIVSTGQADLTVTPVSSLVTTGIQISMSVISVNKAGTAIALL